jgi:hypothetical protein
MITQMYRETSKPQALPSKEMDRREEIAHYCALGARVIQARRRVLDGEQVPTSEKIYSVFEPHTDLIKRGKVRAPVEFGHKVTHGRRRMSKHCAATVVGAPAAGAGRSFGARPAERVQRRSTAVRCMHGRPSSTAWQRAQNGDCIFFHL